ncbi:MAG: FecR family protein, partial [Acidobacteriaceae bacterium]
MKIRPFRVSRRMMGVAVLAFAASLLLFPCAGHVSSAAVNDSATTQAANQVQSSAPVANGPVDEDQASARVARLSDVEGTVQIFRGDQVEFAKAIVNMPIPQGSRIETGADGRAEIEFEDGSIARLTPSSSLGIETLGSAANGNPDTALKQRSGLVYYELRNDGKALYTVLLDQGTVHPKVDSTFRVDLTPAPAALAVIDGDVQVRGDSNDSQVEAHQGQMIQFHPSATAQYIVLDGIIPNGFDGWNDQRDEEAAKQAANQTSARTQQGNSMDRGIAYGWSDLDTYGGWYPLPGYGMVWQPYGVGAGFDPYGFGSWADIGGFGVSWISGYPWGWLPFHCGGWSYINTFGWGWLPGGCGFGGGIGYGYGFGFG